MGTWLTRLSDDHGITRLAQILTRKPTEQERLTYAEYLRRGFATRLQSPPAKPVVPRQPKPYVSWSNHLHRDANSLKLLDDEAARRGDPPTDRLDSDWRLRLEDVLWAVVNSSEFVFTP
jgi:hypothetical protein